MNTTKADAAENVRDSREENSLLSPRQFFLLLLLYFGLQTVIRTLLSGTIDLDESEQLILTQKFAWGYGSQPPLYTWLQILFFKSLGVSVFALALFKNLLLFSLYAFTYFNVRFVTRSGLCGILGAVSLLFIPQVAWESQRDLTHSILASALVTATLFVFLRMSKKSLGSYLLFGFCIGLGMLSKYNYAAFLFGLILSALTIERFRAVIWNIRILLSILVCLALLAPHLLWAVANVDSLTTTTYKFHQQAANDFFSTIAKGTGGLFAAVVFHVAPILLIFGLAFRKRIFSKVALARNEFATLILRQYGFILVGLVLAIFIFRVTGFKDRWFEPIFISIPIVILAVGQEFLNATRGKKILFLGAAVAITVLLLIPGRILLAEKLGRPQLLNAPFASMRTSLTSTIPEDALIIAENKWIGGNLRLQFPERAVLTPELAKFYLPTNAICVVVWDATKSEQPRAVFTRFLSDFCEIDFQRAQPVFVSEKYQHFREKEFRLGIAVVRR